MERRLAAILAADVVGFSRQMGADEAGTLARLAALRTDILDPLLAEHRGRLFKTMGDGFLVEFASGVQAVACAVAVQARLAEQAEGVRLRIGIHAGDVVVQGDDLMGDGVNIAARLEPLAEPGGIVISARVREDLAGKRTVTAEDMGEQALKNIAQPIHAFRLRAPEPERPALPLPDKPSLVVLPFANMSGDPEQEYFADGMVEEITTALSRIRSLFVIARNSAFTYKGTSPDIRKVGRELGVRYVLEGSVRKSGNRVRITGQLIEAETGTHLWADRFDGTLEDVFDLQDKVTADVVTAIAPRVRAAEIQRAQRKSVSDLHAYDLYLRSLPLSKGGSRAEVEEAIRLLRRAVALDPGYAVAHAQLALACWSMVRQQWLLRDDPLVADMVEHAQIALTLDGEDPEILALVAAIIALAGGDFATGIDVVEKAIVLNPNSALAYRQAAVLHGFRGNVAKAQANAEQAERLNPMDPGLIPYFGQVVAHFIAGEYDAAHAWTEKGLRQSQSNSALLRYHTACLGLLGRIDEARAAAARILTIAPNFSIARARQHVEFDMNNAYGKPGVADALYEGLRRAGVPEN